MNMGTGALAKEPGGTLYGQIAQRLREDIAAGRYAAGSTLPSEAVLVKMFQVSRPVVRQALGILEDQGFVYRVQGRGTFVATRGLQSRLMEVAIGPERDTVRYRRRLATRVLLSEEEPASAVIARELRIGPGAPVVHLRRVRFLDGEPLAVLESHLPAHLVPGLARADLTNQSLYEHIETKYGLRILRMRRSIAVGAADEELAGQLQIEPAAPYLRVSSTAMGQHNQIIEDSVASYRGDKITLVTELDAGQTEEPEEHPVQEPEEPSA